MLYLKSRQFFTCMSYVIVAVSRRFFFGNDLCARYGYLLFRHSFVYNVFNPLGTNSSDFLHCVDKNHETASNLLYNNIRIKVCEIQMYHFIEIIIPKYENYDFVS